MKTIFLLLSIVFSSILFSQTYTVVDVGCKMVNCGVDTIIIDANTFIYVDNSMRTTYLNTETTYLEIVDNIFFLYIEGEDVKVFDRIVYDPLTGSHIRTLYRPI